VQTILTYIYINLSLHHLTVFAENNSLSSMEIPTANTDNVEGQKDVEPEAIPKKKRRTSSSKGNLTLISK